MLSSIGVSVPGLFGLVSVTAAIVGAAQTGDDHDQHDQPTSKLDRLEKLLKRKTGASITEMMKATGWQQHSVRGAMAGASRISVGIPSPRKGSTAPAATVTRSRKVNEAAVALVTEIETLDLEGLRSFWWARYGAPPSPRSEPILRQLLAWRVQTLAFGRLDDDTRKGLARTGPIQPEGKHLGLGAGLTRI